MSLDDLRALAHDLNKRLSEAANLSDKLAVGLQNYQPTPDPEPPTPPSTRPIIRMARMLHEVDKTHSIAVQEQRYALQVIQGDQWHLDQLRALQPGPTTTLRYATPVARRANDKPGDSTCLPPDQILNAWMLRDASNNIISRTRDGDQFVDPSNTDYQQAAARYLVDRCTTEGWDGVWLDEIHSDPLWSFPGSWPVKFTTAYRYGVALRGFVNAITPVLRAAGLQVWINLAGDFDSAWANGLATETDGHTIEFFLARFPHETGNTTNGYFQEALTWVQKRAAERKPGYYNAQTTDPALARYALATVLLATEGDALFGAGVDGYPVSGTVWTADMDNARRLGTPRGAHRVTPEGLYTRDFEHGRVTVNPSTKPINTMPATSGQIEVN